MRSRHTSGKALGLFLVIAILALALPAGCKKSSTNPKTAPTANFTGTPRSGDRPLAVDFTDQSNPGSSGITSFLWSFGDGSTSAEPNPSHIYSSEGDYTVTLTVTTADGSDGETKTDYIAVSNGSGPVADFTGDPRTGPPPLEVQFTDQSTAGGASITGRSWSFGDGGTSTSTNPKHTYSTNGTYTVSLTVTTSLGTDPETKTNYITVTSAPVPPTAAFSGSPTTGTAPLTVDFTDESNPGSEAITTWSWNFGDGGTSTAPNPSHTYAAAGTYSVSLTVSTTAGIDSETKTGYITVSSAPVGPTAQFSGTPTSGPTPLAVQFTDQSTAGTSPITARSWNFGDGGTSTATSPSHTYSAAGSYTVTLTVTTNDGQDSETKTDYISVCEAPHADFVGAPTVGLAPLAVVFTDLSTGGATSRSWNFGDGGTSTATSPSHTYQTPGTYDVSLTVTNACGSNTETKTGYITVTDACPNPVYSIANATWDTRTDQDGDGYMTRARLRWNADVTTGCVRSVFAKIYFRLMGETAWTQKGQSSCYNITGTNSDLRSFVVDHMPAQGCYEFQIEIYECGGTTVKAVRGPTDDIDLTNQCFEP